jgi:hypothetical protein
MFDAEYIKKRGFFFACLPGVMGIEQLAGGNEQFNNSTIQQFTSNTSLYMIIKT